MSCLLDTLSFAQLHSVRVYACGVSSAGLTLRANRDVLFLDYGIVSITIFVLIQTQVLILLGPVGSCRIVGAFWENRGTPSRVVSNGLLGIADGRALLLNPWLLDLWGDRYSVCACSMATDDHLLLAAWFAHDIGCLFGSGVRVTDWLVSSHLRVWLEGALCLLYILVGLLLSLT